MNEALKGKLRDFLFAPNKDIITSFYDHAEAQPRDGLDELRLDLEPSRDAVVLPLEILLEAPLDEARYFGDLVFREHSDECVAKMELLTHPVRPIPFASI